MITVKIETPSGLILFEAIHVTVADNGKVLITDVLNADEELTIGEDDINRMTVFYANGYRLILFKKDGKFCKVEA